MKKSLYFLAMLLIIFSCTENENPTTTSERNSFRVEFEHSGDAEKFILSISGITTSGNGWRFLSNGERTNPGFNDFGLTHQQLLQTNPIQVETVEPIQKFTLQYNVVWVPVNPAPAEVIGRFRIFRNDVLIDTKEYRVTDQQQGVASFETDYE